MAEKKKKEKFQRISICYPESVHPGTPEQEKKLRSMRDEIKREMELEKKAKKRSKKR